MIEFAVNGPVNRSLSVLTSFSALVRLMKAESSPPVALTFLFGQEYGFLE